MAAKSPEQSKAEKSIIKRFRKEIWHPFVQALKIYEMISPGDKIAVCISGGKDSFLLAKCMQEIKEHGEIPFDLCFLVMDPGYRKENLSLIRDNARMLGIPVSIEKSDIFESVTNVEDSPCYLCARMRRGFLYAKAKERGCNKIALGHHMDDAIETVLLSVLYAGQFNTMMPKLHSENFPGMELIRPLYLVKEEDIIAWRDFNGLKFLKCACRLTEKTEEEIALGETEKTSKRAEVKELIRTLKKGNPTVDRNILKSAGNVNLDACIGYVKDGKRYSFLTAYGEGRTSSHGIRKEKTTAGKREEKTTAINRKEKTTAGKREEKTTAANQKEKTTAPGKRKKPEGPFYVYLLRCADKSIYCGYTNDLEKRLAAHNAGKGAVYTKFHGPCELVYHETFALQREALRREYAIKQLGRKQKEKLISGQESPDKSQSRNQIKAGEKSKTEAKAKAGVKAGRKTEQGKKVRPHR